MVIEVTMGDLDFDCWQPIIYLIVFRIELFSVKLSEEKSGKCLSI
jgi:hypothetical protein